MRPFASTGVDAPTDIAILNDLVPIPFGFSPGLGLSISVGLFGLGHLRRNLARHRRAA